MTDHEVFNKDFALRVIDMYGKGPDAWRRYIIMQYESYLLFLDDELAMLVQDQPEYLGHLKLLRAYLAKLAYARHTGLIAPGVSE